MGEFLLSLGDKDEEGSAVLGFGVGLVWEDRLLVRLQLPRFGLLRSADEELFGDWGNFRFNIGVQYPSIGLEISFTPFLWLLFGFSHPCDEVGPLVAVDALKDSLRAFWGVDSTDLLPEDAVELVPCAGLVFVQPTGPKNRSYVTFFSCIVSGCDWLLLALFWL